MPETIFDDIVTAVELFWSQRFGEGVQTIVAYPDPRITGIETFPYPCACLSITGIDIDPERRYGSVLGIITKNEEAGTATIQPPPIPIHIDFQIDTLAENRNVDWLLASKVVAVLGAHNRDKLITDQGRTIHLIRQPGGLDAHDDLTSDELWRKAFRFRVQTWLDDPRELQQAILLQEFLLKINEEPIELTFSGGN